MTIPTKKNLSLPVPAAAGDLDPGSLQAQVESIIGLTARLVELLTEELEPVEKRDANGIKDLLKEKTGLVMQYQRSVKNLMGNPATLSALLPAQKESLREAGQRLDAAAAKNGNALNLAAVATQKVLQVIVDTVRREMHSNDTYRNPKAKRSGWGRTAPPVRPISVNQSC